MDLILSLSASKFLPEVMKIVLPVSFFRYFGTSGILVCFRVPELNLICTDKCERTAEECIYGCESDVNCISQCNRDSINCIQSKFRGLPGTRDIKISKKCLRLSM